MAQPVTFHGHGLVLHPTTRRTVCQFVDGVYTTSDPEEIDILSKAFAFDGLLPEIQDDEAPKPKRGRPRNV